MQNNGEKIISIIKKKNSTCDLCNVTIRSSHMSRHKQSQNTKII